MTNDGFIKSVASRLLEQIKNGTAPWQPGTSFLPYNHLCAAAQLLPRGTISVLKGPREVVASRFDVGGVFSFSDKKGGAAPNRHPGYTISSSRPYRRGSLHQIPSLLETKNKFK
jgi:hypothetical protein